MTPKITFEIISCPNVSPVKVGDILSLAECAQLLEERPSAILDAVEFASKYETSGVCIEEHIFSFKKH